MDFRLYQNYPNPFNPSTNISFTVPEREFVTLKVYDALGRLIVTLVNEEKASGFYTVEFNIQQTTIYNQLSSGVYLYRMEAGNFIDTKKLLLLK